MPPENINLEEGIFKGGLKTSAGKNQIVPIHSKIRGFAEHRITVNQGILFVWNDRPITSGTIDRLIGHASKSLTTRTYTHKSIEELRQASEVQNRLFLILS